MNMFPSFPLGLHSRIQVYKSLFPPPFVTEARTSACSATAFGPSPNLLGCQAQGGCHWAGTLILEESLLWQPMTSTPPAFTSQVDSVCLVTHQPLTQGPRPCLLCLQPPPPLTPSSFPFSSLAARTCLVLRHHVLLVKCGHHNCQV